MQSKWGWTYYHCQSLQVVSLNIDYGIHIEGERNFWRENSLTAIETSSKYGKILGKCLIKEWNLNQNKHNKVSEEFYVFNKKNNMTIDHFIYYILRSKSVKNPDHYYKYINSDIKGL